MYLENFPLGALCNRPLFFENPESTTIALALLEVTSFASNLLDLLLKSFSFLFPTTVHRFYSKSIFALEGSIS